MNQILFVFEVSVFGEKRFETVRGGEREEIAVFDSTPTHIRDGKAIMPRQFKSQRVGEILIQQQFHPDIRPGTVDAFASSRSDSTCWRLTVGNCSRK
jgi:hypothetical protein